MGNKSFFFAMNPEGLEMALTKQQQLLRSHDTGREMVE